MKLNSIAKSVFLGSICLMVFLVSMVSAVNIYKTITVQYHGIKININSKRVYPELEPFTYEGRTFVPLRFMAENFGKDVLWDDKTKTIDINDKTASGSNFKLEGTGQQSSKYFTLKKGMVNFKLTHQGEGHFSATLFNKDGDYISLLANHIGNFNGSKVVAIKETKEYIINISAGGPWTITIEQ
jgi:hypothetical protein